LAGKIDIGTACSESTLIGHRADQATMPHTDLNIVATVETNLGRMPANIEAERSMRDPLLLDHHACNHAAELLKPVEFSLDAPAPKAAPTTGRAQNAGQRNSNPQRGGEHPQCEAGARDALAGPSPPRQREPRRQPRAD